MVPESVVSKIKLAVTQLSDASTNTEIKEDILKTRIQPRYFIVMTLHIYSLNFCPLFRNLDIGLVDV